jgi:hypothetical protein
MVEEPGRSRCAKFQVVRASADTALGMSKQWLTRSVSLVAAASVVATGCGSHESPRADNGPIVVVYRVEFPGGEEGPCQGHLSLARWKHEAEASLGPIDKLKTVFQSR